MENHKKTTQEIKTSVFLGGRKIQRFFQHHKTYNPAWNLSQDSLEYIKNIIITNKLKSILEIGTYNALTAISLAATSKEIQVTTIENNPEFMEIAKDNVKKSKQNNITLLEGDAINILQQLKKQKKTFCFAKCAKNSKEFFSTFDLIFIDAKKSEYKDYLINSLNLNPKFIFLDNTISHKDKMKNLFEYLNNSKLNWKELNLGKGLIEIKKMHSIISLHKITSFLSCNFISC